MSKEAMKLALEALEICAVRQEHLWHGLQKLSMAKNALQAALAQQPAQQDQGWKADVQKVRDALDPEDWCGDERMIDVLDRALAQKPCCSNMAAGTSCLADPNPNCPMLAAPQPAQQEPVAQVHPNHLKPSIGGKPWCREVLLYSGCHEGDLLGDKNYRVKLYTHPPAQRKPLADKEQIAEALRRHGLTLIKTASGYDVLKLGQINAHGIKEST